ncbi:MAG: class I SAM-dependent methyltransferase [Deltaproteobacteria bacterium]|nr:class I SAM-dependent methyltransferase [Deltaproteobacteria bacterium]
MAEIFDDWPEKYDLWFETPIGRLIKQHESDLILEMLRPEKGERILDAGCGTGVFTLDVLAAGALIVGLELSLPMLMRGAKKMKEHPFHPVRGDMTKLPFAENEFDKAVSVTAIEFIEDGKTAINELFRVTKPGGCVVVATLNSLSPWAAGRKKIAKNRSSLFEHAFFRSPDQLKSLAPVRGAVKTAIHFQKDEDPEEAEKIEKDGQAKGLETGAFAVVRWEKVHSL